MVGSCGQGLNGELVHVPLMIRFPDRVGAAARTQSLTHPADVWATVLDSVGNKDPRPTEAESLIPTITGETTLSRDRLTVVGHRGHKAIRTPAWHLYDGPRPELYGKPDDRWEVNNVADRYPDLVDSLREALEQFELSLTSQSVCQMPSLKDVLLVGLE